MPLGPLWPFVPWSLPAISLDSVFGNSFFTRADQRLMWPLLFAVPCSATIFCAVLRPLAEAFCGSRALYLAQRQIQHRGHLGRLFP